MADDPAATADPPAGATPPAATDPPATDPPPADAGDGDGKNGELGAEGQKALDAFKGRARAAERENKELKERLEKHEEASKSETEKALDKARKEARKEAETEFEKERRSDRLGVAVAKHARELADVDDVVLNLKQGDTDELFDDEGTVNADALKARLFDKGGLLERKPHLKARGVGKPQGSADGGEGEGGGGESFNDQLRRSR